MYLLSISRQIIRVVGVIRLEGALQTLKFIVGLSECVGDCLIVVVNDRLHNTLHMFASNANVFQVRGHVRRQFKHVFIVGFDSASVGIKARWRERGLYLLLKVLRELLSEAQQLIEVVHRNLPEYILRWAT